MTPQHTFADMPTSVDANGSASSNGGRVEARIALRERFESRLAVNHALTRRAVSYQGNRDLPGFRWLKYKEGFSRGLVEWFIGDAKPESLIDPFSGVGTSPLVAAGRGMRATGIEIMPVGVLVGRAIAHAANGMRRDVFREASEALMRRLEGGAAANGGYGFRHVPITEAAFPQETEDALAVAREFLCGVSDVDVHSALNLACMSVLESVSFTRKDGQYLRWDHRSGRQLRARMHKGPVLSFPEALRARLDQIASDIAPLRERFGGGSPNLITGSSLERLRTLPDGAFDMAITSPPYANRYDYTRTYALELAWLGYDRQGFSKLRQSMLTATVENKSKLNLLREQYRGNPLLGAAIGAYEEQRAIHEVTDILQDHVKELGNPQVIRLIQGYFLEMAVVIAELGRLLRPGGVVIMVNDNVQYHGEELPVDLILSDFAERLGFRCDHIWVLPRGKGNSSQQMGRFGRRELRKCVYRWSRV